LPRLTSSTTPRPAPCATPRSSSISSASRPSIGGHSPIEHEHGPATSPHEMLGVGVLATLKCTAVGGLEEERPSQSGLGGEPPEDK
jgi:hypothetical protein